MVSKYRRMARPAGEQERQGNAVIGHSSNLLGVPMELLVHRDFNDYPMPLHISGVREMNPNLFEMLARSSDLLDAGEARRHSR